MRRMKNIRIRYCDTYFYCNMIMNIINDINYASTINQFFENYFENGNSDLYVFPKDTIAHEFFRWVIDTVMWEKMRGIVEKTNDLSCEIENIYNWIFYDYSGREEEVFIEDLLLLYADGPLDFKKWWIDSVKREMTIDGYEMLERYIAENEERYFQTLGRLADEMFYVLFQNRKFLLWFNETVSSYNLVVCGRKRIPEWVKRTIRYRDKGRCVFCGKDVSGIFETQDDYIEHFDHIVPLAQNGINCVTNIQLTCKDCNESKSDTAGTNDVYINWYDKNE